jgi:outer membrane protein OmpA-like peptidoglycan-associated protein
MRTKVTKLLAILLGIGLIIVSFTIAAAQVAVTQSQRTFPAGEKGEVKGVIIARYGDALQIRDKNNECVTVFLNEATQVESPSGMFRLAKKEHAVTYLLPGLRVEVEGRGNAQGQLVADEVIFSSRDLEIAQAINAGTESARRQEQQLRAEERQDVGEIKRTEKEQQMLAKRVSELDDYDVRYDTTVYFDTGSAELSAKARSELDEIAQKSGGLQGYLIEVAGFTDITGPEAMNQTLSERRALAVVRYLQVNGNVPLRRVLTPAGYGETRGIGDQTTEAGRAQNRRVEVKVLINRALAAK